ncbi:DHA2 family efflux MFS transporter permease subunit [Micromonospora sp. HUAS LYJ1]|uniref:DHA2 family efflux MFS transporter permease subunit n=1 Tax=Micromonospora sp. HUAS LYJ1 TaxID=3061626 RepID=UPI002670F7C4|nr:DHA2 family efflux MFS transporter permease subunit [Micromonospora sp. HUAS LYJ1]WKU07133.1 DHA2 family efflux MFS transporter permease subunit [Micromonospora sp. HUAS LYJ1]
MTRHGLLSEQGKVLLAVVPGAAAVILNNSSLYPAIPVFMDAFQAGVAPVGWIITAFLIAMGVTMPLTGYLGERFGNKRIYLLGLLLFVAGSVLGALSWNLAAVVAARGVQGVAGGLTIPLSLALVFESSPREQRGRTTGIWGAAVMTAPAVGPLAGSAALTLGGWQWLFLMNVPIGLLGLLLGRRHLAATAPDPSRTFDARGFTTGTVGVGAVLLSLGQMSSLHDATEPLKLVPLIAGLALLALFVRIELGQPRPLVHLRAFQTPVYALSVVVTSVQALAMFATIFLIPLLVQNVYGYGPVVTALVFLPSAVSVALFVNVGGKRLDRRGPRGIALAGLGITCAAALLLGTLPIGAPLSAVLALMMLRGAGLGLANMPITAAGLGALPDHLAGQGSAINNISKRMVSALGVVLISIFFQARSDHLLRSGQSPAEGALQAINEGFLAIGAVVFLTLPVAYFMSRPPTATKQKPVVSATENVSSGPPPGPSA